MFRDSRNPLVRLGELLRDPRSKQLPYGWKVPIGACIQARELGEGRSVLEREEVSSY